LVIVGDHRKPMALRNTMTYGAVLRDDRAKCGRSVPNRGRVLVWLDTAIVRNVAPAKVWRRFGSTITASAKSGGRALTCIFVV
jgi:hypothetical protein